MIHNLFKNAIEATEKQPVRLLEVITDAAHNTTGHINGVRLVVRDNGPGFDVEAGDRLFDLYYRAPGASVTAPGAGIGLFVCKRIVEALGGTIWATPRPDGGAEFGFRLPIYEAEDDAVTRRGDRGELATAS